MVPNVHGNKSDCSCLNPSMFAMEWENTTKLWSAVESTLASGCTSYKRLLLGTKDFIHSHCLNSPLQMSSIPPVYTLYREDSRRNPSPRDHSSGDKSPYLQVVKVLPSYSYSECYLIEHQLNSRTSTRQVQIVVNSSNLNGPFLNRARPMLGFLLSHWRRLLAVGPQSPYWLISATAYKGKENQQHHA